MSKIDKLINRFLSNPIPADITFQEVEKVMNHIGFNVVRINGSHHIFQNEKGKEQVFPKPSNNNMKKNYIKKIQLLIIEFREDS